MPPRRGSRKSESQRSARAAGDRPCALDPRLATGELNRSGAARGRPQTALRPEARRCAHRRTPKRADSCSSSAWRNSSRQGAGPALLLDRPSRLSPGRRTSHCGWSTCAGRRIGSSDTNTGPPRRAPARAASARPASGCGSRVGGGVPRSSRREHATAQPVPAAANEKRDASSVMAPSVRGTGASAGLPRRIDSGCCCR